MKWHVLVVSALLVVGGCKKDDDKDGDGGGGGSNITTVEQFDQALFEALCEYFIRCESVLGPTYPDVDSCLGDWAEEQDEASYAVYTLDKSKVQGCIDAIESVQCSANWFDAFDTLEEDCDDVVVGTIDEGACCDDRGGCKADLDCVWEEGEDMGTCEEPAALNGDCSDGYPCADGLYCNEDEQCATPLANGEECDDDSQCVSGYCDYDADPAECAAEPVEDVKELGDDCDDAFECPGFPFGSCVEGVCVANSKKGGECFLDFQSGEALNCASGYDVTCAYEDDLTGTCVDLPKIGESCAKTLVCDEGAFCDEDDMCVANLGAGDDCDPFEDNCGEGLECDQDDEVCVAFETGPLCE